MRSAVPACSRFAIAFSRREEMCQCRLDRRAPPDHRGYLSICSIGFFFFPCLEGRNEGKHPPTNQSDKSLPEIQNPGSRIADYRSSTKAERESERVNRQWKRRRGGKIARQSPVVVRARVSEVFLCLCAAVAIWLSSKPTCFLTHMYMMYNRASLGATYRPISHPKPILKRHETRAISFLPA